MLLLVSFRRCRGKQANYDKIGKKKCPGIVLFLSEKKDNLWRGESPDSKADGVCPREKRGLSPKDWGLSPGLGWDGVVGEVEATILKLYENLECVVDFALEIRVDGGHPMGARARGNVGGIPKGPPGCASVGVSRGDEESLAATGYQLEPGLFYGIGRSNQAIGECRRTIGTRPVADQTDFIMRSQMITNHARKQNEQDAANKREYRKAEDFEGHALFPNFRKSPEDKCRPGKAVPDNSNDEFVYDVLGPFPG